MDVDETKSDGNESSWGDWKADWKPKTLPTGSGPCEDLHEHNMHSETHEEATVFDDYEEPGATDEERHEDSAYRRPDVVVNAMVLLSYEAIAKVMYANDYAVEKAQHGCAGAIIPVVDDNTDDISVLLTKQQRGREAKWEVPKGGATWPDKTPSDTAKRELKQETGAHMHDGYIELWDIPEEASKGLVVGALLLYAITTRDDIKCI